MISFQVYQQDFEGEWFPLFGASYDTEAEAIKRIDTILAVSDSHLQDNEPHGVLRRYFKVRQVVV